MATVIEEFVATLGWEIDAKELDKFQKSINKVKTNVTKAAKVVGVATTAITGLVVVTNKLTAENLNLAKSVGLSAEGYEAMTGVMKNLGFDSKKVTDLVEEMNNKFGELKGLGELITAEEGLEMLGMRFEDIKDLAPEEQFIKIMDTAKEMGDQQRAVSAVDMLMGGDANKFLGHLRSYDVSLAEIVQRQKDLNFQNDQSRKGAVGFNSALNEMMVVVQSITQLFSGLVGEALQPMLENLADWTIANKDLIRSRVSAWARDFATFLRFLFFQVKNIIGAVTSLTDKLGGLTNVVKIAAGAFAAWNIVQIVIGVVQFTKVIKAASIAQALLNAKILLIPILIAAAIALIALIAEDIYRFATGGESVFGKFIDKVADGIEWVVDKAKWMGDQLAGVWKKVTGFFGGIFGGSTDFTALATSQAGAPLPGVSQAVSNNNTSVGDRNVSVSNDIKVTQLPGENGEALASRVSHDIARDIGTAVRNNDSGVEY